MVVSDDDDENVVSAPGVDIDVISTTGEVMFCDVIISGAKYPISSFIAAVTWLASWKI
jgi:hypothetical protein